MVHIFFIWNYLHHWAPPHNVKAAIADPCVHFWLRWEGLFQNRTNPRARVPDVSTGIPTWCSGCTLHTNLEKISWWAAWFHNTSTRSINSHEVWSLMPTRCVGCALNTSLQHKPLNGGVSFENRTNCLKRHQNFVLRGRLSAWAAQ